MTKRRLGLLTAILLLPLAIWQVPTLLKAIPSRYVAAYLPAPVQALAERDHVEVLPTSAASADVRDLLPGSESEQATVLPPPIIVGIIGPTAGDRLTPTPSATPPHTPTPTETPVPIPATHRLENIRHHFQTWNNCGPATLAMALSYYDISMTQEQTAAGLKPDPEDRNVSPEEMAAFVNNNLDLAALDRANGTLDKLRRLVAKGFPVIVELGLDPPGEYRWMGWYGHYLLVVAYDDLSSQVWVYDSWFGTSEVPGENADREGRTVDYGDLDRYWRQFNRNFIVLFPEERRVEVEAIIGPEMDDRQMWLAALERTQLELEQEPENAFLWFNLGTNFNALGDFDRAARAFDQARAIGLPWRMLWYQFGPYEAYYQIGRYDDVVLLADVTLEDRPYFEESYFYKGLALEALGQTQEAIDALRRAARFNPNFSPASEALARLTG